MGIFTVSGDSSCRVAKIELAGRTEYCIAANRLDELVAAYRKLDGKYLPASGLVFAGLNNYAKMKSAVPTVWLQGDSCRDGAMHAAQLIALAGVAATPVARNGKTVGLIYEDEYAVYCSLNGIVPAERQASRAEQTRAALQLVAELLNEHGFQFSDIVRTWFFLDRLLEWYDEFNRVRTEFYQAKGIFKKLVPASTGIGAANCFGTALVCGLLAVRPKDRQLAVWEVESPLQHSPLNYKSSFSRAVEIASPACRRLLISGTASIAPEGETVHRGDPERQIELTMRVVREILRSRQMDWDDVFRGIAYFKNFEDRQVFEHYCHNLAAPAFPLAAVHAAICRDDLLFEIEIDAVQEC